ncbi:TPA: hypothetical protein I8Y21_004285 [Klebsiella oxytoca]|uniref:Uncharacterized protein n=1 Tax=Klebsiella oxytoca TaxID=571 RepID=A0AAN5RF97_KLEOX|nr:hypothetical protein [Klebsiella oxytoca]
MKIEYHDHGKTASVIITSTVFEFRKHIRVVDVTLFLTPEVTPESSGFFIMKTVLSGKTADASRAYRIALKEAQR